MKKLNTYYPSLDGNMLQRRTLLNYFEEVLTLIDYRKDLKQAVFAGELERNYGKLLEGVAVPESGISYGELLEQLGRMVEGNPHFNHRNYLNAIPTPAIPSLLGMLTTMIVNNNALWDVFSPSAAEAELKVTAMMGKVVGYEPARVGGFFTFGGQGGVANSLRIGIEKAAPGARVHGMPANLFCIASDRAHFSVMKAAELGIGSSHVIAVKTNSDDTIHLGDLEEKMTQVIAEGGRIALVLATTGTTDTFAIDDVAGMKAVIDRLVEKYQLDYIPHLHADGAMGGIFTIFNGYDFSANPLDFSTETLQGLQQLTNVLSGVKDADSICMDFHKLGQCPYTNSLFLVKDAADFQRVGLDMNHCPYIGEQSYSNYFTNYSLECSRPGSALAAYANLMVLGLDGYRTILGQLVHLSNTLRQKLATSGPLKVVAANPGPIVLVRAYDDPLDWQNEMSGRASASELAGYNSFNKKFIEQLRKNRANFMFGDTSKAKIVTAHDTKEEYALNALKFFFISPLTEEKDVQDAVDYLLDQYQLLQESLHRQTTSQLQCAR